MNGAYSDQYSSTPPRSEENVRRSKMEMHLDVLEAISRGIEKPTRIMFSANSSWLALNRALTQLESNELIKKDVHQGRVKYSLTEKGFTVLSSYKDFRQNLDI